MSEKIAVELDRNDVINLLCGSATPQAGMPQITYEAMSTKDGPYFRWDREAMRTVPIDELMQVYALLNWSKPRAAEQPKSLIITG